MASNAHPGILAPERMLAIRPQHAARYTPVERGGGGGTGALLAPGPSKKFSLPSFETSFGVFQGVGVSLGYLMSWHHAAVFSPLQVTCQETRRLVTCEVDQHTSEY